MVVVPASLASSNPAAARPTRASSVLAPASRRPPRGTSAGAAAFTRRRALTMHVGTHSRAKNCPGHPKPLSKTEVLLRCTPQTLRLKPWARHQRNPWPRNL